GFERSRSDALDVSSFRSFSGPPLTRSGLLAAPSAIQIAPFGCDVTEFENNEITRRPDLVALWAGIFRGFGGASAHARDSLRNSRIDMTRMLRPRQKSSPAKCSSRNAADSAPRESSISSCWTTSEISVAVMLRIWIPEYFRSNCSDTMPARIRFSTGPQKRWKSPEEFRSFVRPSSASCFGLGRFERTRYSLWEWG